MGEKLDKNYYQLSVEETYRDLDSSRYGLTTKEVSRRISEIGPNKLKEFHKDPWYVKYGRQFKDLMIFLLIISSIVSFAFEDPRVGIALLAIVFLNTYMGFRQEYKAEKIMESLEKLVVPVAKVVRNGKVEEIASVDLVPGDIVYIEEGDSVPADMRIIESSELSTNDFALTGESNPCRKNTDLIKSTVPIGDRYNLVYMGTTVATGKGYGVVHSTGMNTELGRIANLSADTVVDESPLQKEMNNISTKVTKAIVLLFIILLLIAFKVDLGAKESFLLAVAIAMSLVPQGLPAAFATILAQAAKKMVNDKALVKKLSSVETLGATSIICTDKTGTLTKNQMTVEQLIIGKNMYSVTGSGYEAKGNIQHDNKNLSAKKLGDLSMFFVTGVFASNAKISAPDDEHATWYCIGDPTEGALITLANKAGINIDEIEEKYKEEKQFSFDSGRKLMSSIRPWGDKKQNYVFVKGAPESILNNSVEIWDNGKVRKITSADKKFVLDKNEELAKKAMRNLALAYRIVDEKEDVDSLSMEKAESKLAYLGMVSMVDPVREEVPAAMEVARKAHIKVSIITGDYATTAKAVAEKAGLISEKHGVQIITGNELQKVNDEEIINKVLSGNIIFSRVSPEDKLRIVGLVKDNGNIVAVTGDGINDAPALKRADIGVAMGVTGTDVAKQSAEIVLLDDSFKTLVGAVQQGRIIFQNIKKITLVAFCANTSELVINLASLVAAAMFSTPIAITVMLILAIDLIAELFPMVALGWDEAEGEVMSDEPRDPKQHILNKNTMRDVIWVGLLIGTITFANFLFFFVRRGINPSLAEYNSPMHMQATTLTYVTIMICQLFNILHLRTTKGIFSKYQFHNPKFIFAIGLSLFCIANIVYNPWVSPFFRAAPLNGWDWVTALVAGAIFVVFREMGRFGKQDHRDNVIDLHKEVHQS
ncbi:cation-transporting P-type ATPase [Candidatus Saccharibacteria bacterium]|nr:cation-transporting P-type ATPase [Candidatus Saccharibacteria bacterium]